MEATNGSMIDFKNPYWLRSIGGVIEVAKKRPSVQNGDVNAETEFDHLMTGLADAIHSLVNNTCRACGLEMGGSDSEATWEHVKRLRENIEEFIRHEWARQDREAEHQRITEEREVENLKRVLISVNNARIARGLVELKLVEGHT